MRRPGRRPHPAPPSSCRRPSRRSPGRSGRCARAVVLVGGSDVGGVTTDDADVIGGEPCLDPEGASGPPLAGKAVAHGDPDRIALRRQVKLPAATGGGTGSHRRRSYPRPTASHEVLLGGLLGRKRRQITLPGYGQQGGAGRRCFLPAPLTPPALTAAKTRPPPGRVSSFQGPCPEPTGASTCRRTRRRPRSACPKAAP